MRDAYVKARLTDPDPERGQLAYYSGRAVEEELKLRVANWTFGGCSITAILATLLKLSTWAVVLPIPVALASLMSGGLGMAAIVLPVLAVGALSWAAAQDYEARVQTFRGILKLLEEQRGALEMATSERTFRQLVEKTELELLGETAEWYSRRTYGGIT